MKASTMGSVMACVILLPIGAEAQRLGTIELAAFGRYTAMSVDRSIENALGIGGAIGIHLTRRFKLTTDVSYTPSQSELDGSDISYVPLHVRLAYQLPLTPKIGALAGVGYVYKHYSNNVEESGLSGALGVRLALSEQIGLYGQVVRDWMPPWWRDGTVVVTRPNRDPITVVWKSNAHDAIEAGISARFGGRPPALVATVEPVRTPDRVETAQQQQPPPRPQPQPPLQEKAAEPAPERFVTLDPIYFDFDRAELRADEREYLMRVAAILRANADAVVVIEGHTDPRGSDAYNLALGSRRAQNVRAFLLAQNIEPRRLELASRGEKLLADPSPTEAGYARNRRVEFRLPMDTRLREPR
jgi:outer membrane protein OmpA-like peptidoglycan-associated protein